VYGLLDSHPISAEHKTKLIQIALAIGNGAFERGHGATAYYILAQNDYGYDQDSFMPTQTASIFSNNVYTIPVVLVIFAIGAVFAIKKGKKNTSEN